MRKRIFEIIEFDYKDDTLSKCYDLFMMLTIFVSIIPLAFKEQTTALIIIDKVTVVIYIIDYLLRFITADLKYEKWKMKSFLIYPFTPFAIIDLIAILPSIMFLHNNFKLFRIFRLIRSFRVLRLFKAIRYSKSITVLFNIFREQKEALLTVLGVAIAYILISALIILNVEPQTFKNYFDAVYWATISLTTIGYGDIYPVSTAGKMITMLSSLLGIAVIALPAGIITAGFMKEVNKKK